MVIAGGVVSRTVTVKLASALLPAASAAWHVTVVVPNGNMEPDPALHATGTLPSVSSVAVGAFQVATAPAGPVASTTIGPGTAITGGMVSDGKLPRTETDIRSPFETTKSRRPSPSKSTNATSTGCSPVSRTAGGPHVPSP